MKSKKIRYLVLVILLSLGNITAYGVYQAPSTSQKFLKPVAAELKLLATDILVDPVAFGFVSYTLCGKDFYKPCLLHFLLRPRLQELVGRKDRVPLSAGEEVLRYSIGAAASTIAPLQFATLCITYRMLSKLIKASGAYLRRWFSGTQDYDAGYILLYKLPADTRRS